MLGRALVAVACLLSALSACGPHSGKLATPPGGTGSAGATECPAASPPNLVPLAFSPAAAGMVAVPSADPMPPCQTNCLYVDASTGSDDSCGRTLQQAFKTLTKAAQVAQPGDTVTVMNGTYTRDSATPLVLTTSGTPTAWIAFVAGPGQHPVIQMPKGKDAWSGIEIHGASYLMIEGFEIAGQNQSITDEEGHRSDKTTGYLNASCIHIDGMQYASIPHDIVIRNNVLHDCSSAGVNALIADAITIAYNKVYNNGWWTVYGTSGLSFYHQTDVPGSAATNGYKNYVVGNWLANNHNNLPWIDGNPPAIYDGNGIIIDDNMHTQAAISAHDPTGVPYTGRTYIANNIVRDTGGHGIHAYVSARIDMVNNTTYNNLLSDSPYITAGEIDAPSCHDVNIVNNIAVNLNGKAVNVKDGASYMANTWMGSATPWLGADDQAGDPQFENPAGNDFAPRIGSPALASGRSVLAPSLDFGGAPRPSGRVDRGAIQATK